MKLEILRQFFRRMGVTPIPAKFKWRTKAEGGDDVPNFLRKFDRIQRRAPSSKILY